MTPKNDFYAGFLYHYFFDPFTTRLRNRVSTHIPPGSSVLDVGCGTGYQLLRLAPQITTGLGIDRADRMIAFARRQQKKRGIDNLTFDLADAADLSHLEDNRFDLGIMTLVLHEMEEELRIPALREIARVTRRQILVDYAVSPGTFSTALMHVMEITAGILHFHSFRSYLRSGAGPGLCRETRLRTIGEESAMLGMTRIWVCEKK